jgi:hypothetical protein
MFGAGEKFAGSALTCWRGPMIEDIEAAKQFDLTPYDIDQFCEALGVHPFDLFVPERQR